MNEQIIGYDLDGFNRITDAIRAIVNTFPGLDPEERIQYATLSEDGGIAMFPTGGAQIRREKESITGHVSQECLYPFFILYRASGLSENIKVNVKEWLDTFGRWLTLQPVTIGEEVYKLIEYPPISDGRVIKSINVQSPAYLDSIGENKAENWMINLNVTYLNEYDK